MASAGKRHGDPAIGKYEEGCLHNDSLKAALKGTALKDLRCLEVNGMDGLREIFRMLTAHKTVVQVAASGPPAVSARALQR